ncbi:uncharacterized protein I303_100262 [Kwoniella dejecticola CBS 10117]|uniref:choline-phosphate cytidylyltransferase n=1 Tax=Kwoniella dejecticola CBS 10117 TaxID=1296121 RepID=A0A1A6AEE3_9TREE|nr:choline-phosphate cytidylyltransferase [Kwoniella dejecticola CBS 10117]OBR88446.1 choline-phosphate cytidylyltransferase [Kwoniella dejecticola CBS 10117]
MATSAAAAKRHTRNRLGERRAARDPSSSRDASEEDNDNIENEFSDVGSIMSTHADTISSTSTADSPRMQSSTSPLHVAAAAIAATNASSSQPLTKRALHQKRVEELNEPGSMSEGLDSPTYDGDIESSSTIGGTPVHSSTLHQHMRSQLASSPTKSSGLGLQDLPTATASSPYGTNRLPTPKASKANLLSDSPPPSTLYERPTDVPVAPSKALAEPRRSQTLPLSAKPSMSSLGPPKMYTRPIELSEENIKSFVERAIHGKGAEDGVERWWRTNPPPEGKVVRVYADGVYDLFHFGHALQLRQAKLSFPKVHLLVGVCSDDLCASHKSRPAMTHAERCEAVRHCRWVDEILPDAPWVVDQEWLDKYDIDYIAHDEEVYPSKDHEDVYAFSKKDGRFVPTRRTPAISTSDLLERIVRGYRDGFFDSKLEKNGHPELLAADVDWDSSASVEKRERRKEQAAHAHAHKHQHHQHSQHKK